MIRANTLHTGTYPAESALLVEAAVNQTNTSIKSLNQLFRNTLSRINLS
jgi:hypothetical protein